MSDINPIYGNPIGSVATPGSGGGTDSGVGKTTEAGGEIFNDYDDNLAGSKAFTVLGVTCSKNDGSASGTYTLDSTDGLAVGDEFSVHLAQSAEQNMQCDNAGKITAISGNVVTVDNVFVDPHFSVSKFQIWEDGYLDADGYDSEVNTFRVPAKPNVGTRTIGYFSSARGRYTRALSKGANAEGMETVAAGSWSHAEGRKTYAAYSAHAEGVLTEAIGQGSHAEGQGTRAEWWASHAEGTSTQALNNSAHSEGSETKATGTASHAEGTLSEASGNYSHSEGYDTKAIGNNSHSEGTSTQATKPSSHAEGYLSIASAEGAHAEGYNTKATGGYSHAEGCFNESRGWASHASGEHTIAIKANHFAVGAYNDWKKYEPWTTTKSIIPLFTIGNGTSDTARKNAFEVFADGHAELQTVGTEDNSVVTKDYVDGKFRISVNEPTGNIPDGTIWIKPLT